MNNGVTLQSVLARIEQYRKEALESVTKRYANEKKQADATYLFVFEANAAGLKLDLPSSMYDATGPTYTIENVLDFRIIHHLVGKLVDDGKTAADCDARKRLVWCYLRPEQEQFKHLRFKFKRKMPRGSKCMVKRIKQKAYWTTTVVCDS